MSDAVITHPRRCDGCGVDFISDRFFTRQPEGRMCNHCVERSEFIEKRKEDPVWRELKERIFLLCDKLCDQFCDVFFGVKRTTQAIREAEKKRNLVLERNFVLLYKVPSKITPSNRLFWTLLCQDPNKDDDEQNVPELMSGCVAMAISYDGRTIISYMIEDIKIYEGVFDNKIREDVECQICYDTGGTWWRHSCNRCHVAVCGMCYFKADMSIKGCPYCTYNLQQHFTRVFKIKA